MRHEWQVQPIGDYQCLICGQRSMVPDLTKCVGKLSISGVKSNCCGHDKDQPLSIRDTAKHDCLLCAKSHLETCRTLANAANGKYNDIRVIGYMYKAVEETKNHTELNQAIKVAFDAYNEYGTAIPYEELMKMIDQQTKSI